MLLHWATALAICCFSNKNTLSKATYTRESLFWLTDPERGRGAHNGEASMAGQQEQEPEMASPPRGGSQASKLKVG